jgi:hypothetical protein
LTSAGSIPSDIHEAIWQKLYDAVGAVFSELLQQGLIKEPDYFVVEDDWGWDIVQTEIVISSLWPQIARRFQSILSDFPDWRITMQVMRKYTDKQPGMGVIVSVDGFKDELKREYFPEELRSIAFD